MQPSAPYDALAAAGATGHKDEEVRPIRKNRNVTSSASSCNQALRPRPSSLIRLLGPGILSTTRLMFKSPASVSRSSAIFLSSCLPQFVRRQPVADTWPGDYIEACLT